MKHPTHNQAGMSLIEVIVSVFVMAAMVVLYIAALNVNAMTRRMRHENLAYHIASKKMEEIRNTPYGSLPASGSFIDPLMSELPHSAGTITVAVANPGVDIADVTVEVTWNNNAPGGGRSYRLQTIVSPEGINP